MAGERLIECIDLHVALGGREVLRGVSFAIEAAEIVGVVGRSGQGKTTLIKALVGLLPIRSGAVRIGGRSLAGASEEDLARLRRRVGVVFQGGALFDSLSVAENVGFHPQRVGRARPAEVRRLVEEKLSLVGLEDAAGLMPSQLSGGMAKRVGIARALAMEPEAILYDEPSSNLDPATRNQIERLIVRLRDDLGVAAMIVSHDVDGLLRTADRIVVLADGAAAADLSAREFRSSTNPAVARLLGNAREGESP